MHQYARRTSLKPAARLRIPPLQNGDHLTSYEFEQRFDATPRLKKAELIDGRVYVAPPVSHVEHSFPHGQIMLLVGLYSAMTPGLECGDNGSVRIDKKNVPQPDVYLFVSSSHGGKVIVGPEGYLEHAPDFVAEIAASSASYDLHEKFRLYAKSGVTEYLVWQTIDEEIELFSLRDGNYVSVEDDNGVFKSVVFPGLWIDANALLSRDPAAALATVQKGIASTEHATFVESLRQKMKPAAT